MKFLHTADLHLGQIMYQNYSREDEHSHFFDQLKAWCREHKPDALLVSGDVFDIQQPGAEVKRRFNEFFVALHRAFPQMSIVITAGNHDSASRIHADNAVWSLGNIKVVGIPPSKHCLEEGDGWQDEYIVELASGYVIALPFSVAPKGEILQSLLNYISAKNVDNKPVVVMEHLSVTGMDATGHGTEIGHIETVSAEELGSGYDYMALGHIHRPQTIGHLEDEHEEASTYPAGVIRYSGSALHVSCDEKYPHTVSLVEIDHHGGEVKVSRLRIDEKRHFYELPKEGSFTDLGDIYEAVRNFAEEQETAYFRLSINYDVPIPSDFNQQIYNIIEASGKDIRYNPKIIWPNKPADMTEAERPVFDVADLQQMTDPMQFIEQTIGSYPDLDLDDLRAAFKEIEEEMKSLETKTR